MSYGMGLFFGFWLGVAATRLVQIFRESEL